MTSEFLGDLFDKLRRPIEGVRANVLKCAEARGDDHFFLIGSLPMIAVNVIRGIGLDSGIQLRARLFLQNQAINLLKRAVCGALGAETEFAVASTGGGRRVVAS